MRSGDHLSPLGNWYALRQELAGRPVVPVRGLFPFRLSIDDEGWRLQIWRRGVGGHPGAVYAEVTGQFAA